AAVPGDLVEMRDKHLIINGQEDSYVLSERTIEYFDGGRSLEAVRVTESDGKQAHVVQWLPGIAARDSFGPMRIPPDQFLMLGDNRDDSADSRYIGLVPRKLLIGHAVRVLVSADIKGNWAPRTDRFGKKL
ncbi:MAG: signal peptidase I, partial [Burkholderiaceae bacterium]|nr:signal peptidase I [Burkholderiaceae bacterium]